ncbi:putative mitochondrial protein, partial [Mucuna pruriens]
MDNLKNLGNFSNLASRQMFGYPPFSLLKIMFSHLFTKEYIESYYCDVCQLSKHHRATFSPSNYKSLVPFDLIHFDVWGQLITLYWGLRVDNGTKFVNLEFSKFLKDNGLTHELTNRNNHASSILFLNLYILTISLYNIKILLQSLIIKTPTSVQEALKDENWVQAMKEEMKAYKDKRVVGCRWIYIVKCKFDGTLDQYKVRLVAKGYTHTYGIDHKGRHLAL